jgi:hypothetical protein
MMTLNRYLLVGKDQAPLLVKMAKLEFKWVIRGSIVFSAIINIGHGFEYEVIERVVNLNMNLDYYAQANGYSYSDYPEANQSQPYFIYSVVYFLINFGLFFIMNTGIEIKIVRCMQKELREKRERMARMNTARASTLPTNSTAGSGDVSEKKREDEDAIKERKVIKMVVLNSAFNFVLRAPEMLFWLENASIFTFFFKPSGFYLGHYLGTRLPGLLSLVTDVAYLTYILTFTTNFIIFYKFNSKFKEAMIFFNNNQNKKNLK